ncbi:MAG TPA: TIR domain-containing protein [Pseudonocardiaceae bacterium]|nr:TIR domain-containing protein [Pseudonocardiaceae bacterium]
MSDSDRSPDAREYDVCLSFAGEQRDYVDVVAAHLREKNVHVFYDRFLDTGLLGEDLIEYFDSVFRRQSRFCVVFISADYLAKEWTTHEWRSIRNRAFHNAGIYVLPVRFDDTELPGVLDTVFDVDARHTPAVEAAELIYTKIISTPPPGGKRGANRQALHTQPTARERDPFGTMTQHAQAITNIAGDAPNGIFGPVGTVVRETGDV